MNATRGDRTFVTLLLALVLIVAGLLAVDGWQRSRDSRTTPQHPKPATVVEVPQEPDPAPPPAPRPSQRPSEDIGGVM